MSESSIEFLFSLFNMLITPDISVEASICFDSPFLSLFVELTLLLFIK